LPYLCVRDLKTGTKGRSTKHFSQFCAEYT